MSELVRRTAEFGSSARRTGALLRRGQLRLPVDHAGWWLAFRDGSRLRVYRETVRLGTRTERPALLVVRFRLRLLRRSRLLHALFRAESILNTPLFAGFPGFRSKLWATDPYTGGYRGVYQWDGADRAERYATALLALLRPFCVPGSLAFHVEPGVWRDDLLRQPDAALGASDAAGGASEPAGGPSDAAGGPSDAAGAGAADWWWRPQSTSREAGAAK